MTLDLRFAVRSYACVDMAIGLKETADDRFPLNSVEDVLGEVVRQQAEFEAERKESEEG